MCSVNMYNEMSFLEVFQAQKKTLLSQTYVNILWKEMVEDIEDPVDNDTKCNYTYHYPVDLEGYFRALTRKIIDYKEGDFDKLDGHLKAYILTTIYFCTKNTPHISLYNGVLASHLYMEIINCPRGHLLYMDVVFKNVLNVVSRAVSKRKLTDIEELISLISRYTQDHQQELEMLGVTGQMYSEVIFLTTQDIVKKFAGDSLEMICYNNLYKMIQKETDEARSAAVMNNLFLSYKLTDAPLTADQLSARQENTRKFIKEVLLPSFDERKMQGYIRAFTNLWGYSDFKYFKEATVLAGDLELKDYKEVVRKLGLMLQSKNHKHCLIQLFEMLYQLIKSYTPNQGLDKVEVLYETAFRHLILQCLSPTRKVVNKALEILAEICSLRYNEIVNIIICNVVNKLSSEPLNFPTILRAFYTLVEPKWSLNSRNRSLIKIISRFASVATAIDARLCNQLMYAACWGTTPLTLKSCLPYLHDMYLNMMSKGHIAVAMPILRIMYKMAMHPDAAASEFRVHLYDCISKPCITLKAKNYSSEYYSAYLLTENFHYMTFFERCKAQGLVEYRHLSNSILCLNHKNRGNLMFMCTMLHLHQYVDSKKIAAYLVQEETNGIYYHENTKYILMALNKILVARPSSSFSDFDYPHLQKIHDAIREGILAQALPVSCFQNAYEVFLTLRKILKINLNTQILGTIRLSYNKKVEESLNDLYNFKPLLYATELMLTSKYPPTNDVLRKLIALMSVEGNRRAVQDNFPQAWPALLMYYANISFLNKDHVPLAVECLTGSLFLDNTILKLTAIKLLHSLSFDITHEYATIARFCFKEIVGNDISLAKLSATYLEELVHKDYLKLSEEEYMKFIYLLGCPESNMFMKELLGKRFLLSNQTIIARYYINIIIYSYNYRNSLNYHISEPFAKVLKSIGRNLLCPKDIFSYTFRSLSVPMKFKVLKEISLIFSDLINGRCKVSEGYFEVLSQCIYTFRLMIEEESNLSIDEFYSKVIMMIDKQILRDDPQFRDKFSPCYTEYKQDLKDMMPILIDLLLFNENEALLNEIREPIFEVIMYWTEFFKGDIADYIINEREADLMSRYRRVVKYYTENKDQLLLG